MKLRRNEYCPIHRSLLCCGREQAQKERRFQLGVQRIEDPHHPEGLSRTPVTSGNAEAAEPKDRGAEGEMCNIRGLAFTDYNEIVPDHIEPAERPVLM